MGKSLFDPIVGQFPGHMNVCRDMAKPLAQKIRILNGTGGVERSSRDSWFYREKK